MRIRYFDHAGCTTSEGAVGHTQGHSAIGNCRRGAWERQDGAGSDAQRCVGERSAQRSRQNGDCRSAKGSGVPRHELVVLIRETCIHGWHVGMPDRDVIEQFRRCRRIVGGARIRPQPLGDCLADRKANGIHCRGVGSIRCGRGEIVVCRIGVVATARWRFSAESPPQRGGKAWAIGAVPSVVATAIERFKSAAKSADYGNRSQWNGARSGSGGCARCSGDRG